MAARTLRERLAAIAALTLAGLEKSTSGESAHAELSSANRSARDALRLVEQLAAFAEQLDLAPDAVRLEDWVTTRVEEIRRVLGSEVSLVIGALGGVALVDPQWLDELLWALVRNAREAMPSGGTLTIRAAEVAHKPPGARGPDQPYVSLVVADSGAGIDEALAARVFDPFFTTKSHRHHSGLGLSAARGVARQSGGDLLVSSARGQGVTATLLLPRAESGRVSSTTPPRPTVTVLLAEDQDQVRLLAQRVLERGGYRVLVAADGDAAIRLSAAHSGAIEILVTDVVMPGLNGKELAERLSSERPQLRVLFMSGFTNRVFGEGGLGPGVSFLQKPFTPTMLLSAVRGLLDGARVSR